MNKKEGGFGLAGIVLLIVVVTMVGGAVYYVGSKQNKKLVTGQSKTESSKNSAVNRFNEIFKGPVVDKYQLELICNNGNSGKGLDNNLPWALYLFKTKLTNSEDIQVDIMKAAEDHGLVLSDDKSTKESMDLPGYRNSTYLKADKNSENLEVRIAKNSDSVSPDCTINDKYMPELVVAPDEILIEFHNSLPRL